jgi:hypothetical protein
VPDPKKLAHCLAYLGIVFHPSPGSMCFFIGYPLPSPESTWSYIPPPAVPFGPTVRTHGNMDPL